MSPPILKEGALESPTFLAFVRRLGCWAPTDEEGTRCGKTAQSHHFPYRSHCTDDTKTLPLCRHHHDEAHAGRISREWQEEQTFRVLRLFVETATESEWRAFDRDLGRYRESRVFMEYVPS